MTDDATFAFITTTGYDEVVAVVVDGVWVRTDDSPSATPDAVPIDGNADVADAAVVDRDRKENFSDVPDAHIETAVSCVEAKRRRRWNWHPSCPARRCHDGLT